MEHEHDARGLLLDEMNEQFQSVDPLLNTQTGLSSVLTLVDNSSWGISAVNSGAHDAIARLTEIMQLEKRSCANTHLHVFSDTRERTGEDHSQKILGSDSGTTARVTGIGMQLSLFPLSIEYRQHNAICRLQSASDSALFSTQLNLLSLIIARSIEKNGGLLLHGALAEFNGAGVILAGPGNIGKTTASDRFPKPWRSLSDDASLMVRDVEGKYWAHPWPTWSRFLHRGPGGTWNVEYAVPLEGIFFLTQSEVDNVSSIGAGQAATLLSKSSEEASAFMPFTTDDDIRKHRIHRFNTICSLAGSVSTHILNLSLTGTFWHLLENTLAEQQGKVLA